MKLKTGTLTLIVAAITLYLLACGGGGPPGGGSGGPAGLRVDILPNVIQVPLGGQYQFNATVVNSSNQQVIWSVLGFMTGNIDPNGLYTAPNVMPGAGAQVKIQAAAVADPTVMSTADINLYFAPPPTTFPIDLTVASRTGWLSTATPVTSGVPFSKGTLPSENVLQVTTGAGANVPAQFRVMSRWPDNSVRWVLVDFIANTTGGGIYRLNNNGSGSATGTNLSVNNSASSITVQTGVLTFMVSKTAFRLFESIMIDRDGAGGVNDECLNTSALNGVVVTDTSTNYLMNQIAPDSIAVEEQGPMRVCIRVEGRHRSTPTGADKLRYIVRIHAWNDQPFIKVVYSYKNMQNHGQVNAGPASEAAQLAAYQQADSVALNLPLSFSGNPGVLFGGDPSNHQGTLTTGQTATMFQSYSGTYDPTDSENLPQPGAYNSTSGDGSGDTLTNCWPTSAETQISYTMNGGVITGSGGRAPGYMEMALGVGGNNLRVTSAIRDFWQQYPQALTAQGDGTMKLEFWPSLAPKLQVFEGVMKTHEALFMFERQAGLLAATGALVANMISDPPFAACRPQYYRSSLAFGHHGRTNSAFADLSGYSAVYQSIVGTYLFEFVRHFNDMFNDRSDGNGTAVGHEYGYWNYGDGKVTDGSGAWDNHDYSEARACFVWFAASANREVLSFGDLATRHFRDIVVVHSDVGRRYNYTEPGNPAIFTYGAAQQTSQLGKSRFTANNKQHDMGNYHFGSHNMECLRGEMLGDHYFLFGDGLSKDVLAEAYLFVRGTWKRHFDANNGGQDNTADCPTIWMSNALFTAVSHYLCTGSADALTMAQYILARIRTRQTNVEPNDPNGAGFCNTSGSFQAWMLGHLLEALEYYRWVMDDTTVDANMLSAMNWLLGTNASVYLGNPPTNIPGAFAELPGGMTDYGAANLLIGAGYLSAFRASNDPQWKVRASNLLSRQTTDLQSETDATITHRNFALFFRCGPQLLACLEP